MKIYTIYYHTETFDKKYFGEYTVVADDLYEAEIRAGHYIQEELAEKEVTGNGIILLKLVSVEDIFTCTKEDENV